MNLVIPEIDLVSLGPELILSVAAMLVLLVSVFLPKGRKDPVAYLSLLGIVFALISSVVLWGKGRYAFNNMILVDNFALFFTVVLLIASGLSILITSAPISARSREHNMPFSSVKSKTR